MPHFLFIQLSNRPGYIETFTRCSTLILLTSCWTVEQHGLSFLVLDILHLMHWKPSKNSLVDSCIQLPGPMVKPGLGIPGSRTLVFSFDRSWYQFSSEWSPWSANHRSKMVCPPSLQKLLPMVGVPGSLNPSLWLLGLNFLEPSWLC